VSRATVELVVIVVVAAGTGFVGGLELARRAAVFPDEPEDSPTDRPQVPAVALALVTAVLFALTALRFGVAWELPAFLVLARNAVLLTVIDVRHRLLPNAILLPAFAAGAILLTAAAALTGEWWDLLRAGAAALVLFAVYLVLALIAPRSLGMGDVKLAGLLGLYLGWLGWDAVVLGAAAGFVVQALLALALLAGRRIGLRSELPFGPAMLVGAAMAIAGGDLLVR
jgi:leader peptidase (prepilin peptidase) / N-methyltransferase